MFFFLYEGKSNEFGIYFFIEIGFNIIFYFSYGILWLLGDGKFKMWVWDGGGK